MVEAVGREIELNQRSFIQCNWARILIFFPFHCLQKRKKLKNQYKNRPDNSLEGRQLVVWDPPAPAVGLAAKQPAHLSAPHCSRHPSSPYHSKALSHYRTRCHWRFAHSHRMGWESRTIIEREAVINGLGSVTRRNCTINQWKKGKN